MSSPQTACPACQELKLRRKIGPGAAILFKGSGFYQTDYRSSSYTEGAKKESPSSDSKPADAAAKTAPASPPAKPAPASEPKSSKSARKKPS
jgi:predicted nucleic acid-binding Zn ribbon protein